MITNYGLHPAQDAAIAAHDLRHAVRAIATTPALTLAADMLDVVSAALDAHWRDATSGMESFDRRYPAES